MTKKSSLKHFDFVKNGFKVFNHGIFQILFNEDKFLAYI